MCILFLFSLQVGMTSSVLNSYVRYWSYMSKRSDFQDMFQNCGRRSLMTGQAGSQEATICHAKILTLQPSSFVANCCEAPRNGLGDPKMSYSVSIVFLPTQSIANRTKAHLLYDYRTYPHPRFEISIVLSHLLSVSSIKYPYPRLLPVIATKQKAPGRTTFDR